MYKDDEHKGNDLSFNVFTTSGGYNRGNDLSLSLSLCTLLLSSHLHQQVWPIHKMSNNHIKFCPRSYLY